MEHRFIAIEGNIGAGKTTLATKIAEQFQSKLVLEKFADNPFLPKFYDNAKKYSFPLELSFLAQRHKQLKEELSNHALPGINITSDYFFGKSIVFAKANLSPDEFLSYSKLFNVINNALPQPDLLVYLHLNLDRIKENIKTRARSYEQKINETYLLKIQNTYFDFMQQLNNMKILVIDIDNADFVLNSSDYEKIVLHIKKNHNTGITRISA